MPIALNELTEAIDPGKTALVLGAGASIPSGAPSGAALAEHLWKTVAKTEPQSSDLIETTSILARKYGRKSVVDAVIDKLKPLKPTGGLLGIPLVGWKAFYGTNFDTLLEQAFKASSVPLAVYRSNFDFSNKESVTGVKYFKIHGCITQDETRGDKASMILTEDDYQNFENYRQTLFGSLNSTLLTGDVLVVGHSLRDPHLVALIRKILDAKQQGAPGTLYALIFDQDDLRAPLLEDRGVRISFGGIDDLIHALGNAAPTAPAANPAERSNPLPLAVVSTVTDARLSSALAHEVARMFHGAPASYSDIRSGSTFERAGTAGLVEDVILNTAPVFAIIGAAGVGKTTFARQLVSGASKKLDHAWEHKSDFVFQHRHWISIEESIRARGESAVLLIDECTPNMRSVNQLVEHLNVTKNPSLRLIVTANAAQWTPRMKSPIFYSKGRITELSTLVDEEIYSLINLVEFNKDISGLVTAEFKSRNRNQQFAALRQKCSADMFVCLKNVFATESLDDILLDEYRVLSEPLQEYYRYVAALQAVGAKVHRQLIIRMLKMPPAEVSAVLSGLNGIIDEYDIDRKEGIYGWTTRHLVIARKIAEYKFSSYSELEGLFDALIENVNPSMPIELQTVRNICDAEFGIGRLADPATRKRLYNKLIAIVPGERIPWHRLIREALVEGDFQQTEYLIRDAESAVGVDAPIDRFKVRLMLVRAQKTPRIEDKDRLAILRKAYEAATSNIKRHHWDKFSYTTLCDVAVEMVERGESEYLLEEALQNFRTAAERIQDPEMARHIRHYETVQARLRR